MPLIAEATGVGNWWLELALPMITTSSSNLTRLISMQGLNKLSYVLFLCFLVPKIRRNRPWVNTKATTNEIDWMAALTTFPLLHNPFRGRMSSAQTSAKTFYP